MFKLNSHPGIIHLAVHSKLIVQAAQCGGGRWLAMDIQLITALG